jgi:hypothetical protein
MDSPEPATSMPTPAAALPPSRPPSGPHLTCVTAEDDAELYDTLVTMARIKKSWRGQST